MSKKRVGLSLLKFGGLERPGSAGPNQNGFSLRKVWLFGLHVKTRLSQNSLQNIKVAQDFGHGLPSHVGFFNIGYGRPFAAPFNKLIDVVLFALGKDFYAVVRHVFCVTKNV